MAATAVRVTEKTLLVAIVRRWEFRTFGYGAVIVAPFSQDICHSERPLLGARKLHSRRSKQLQVPRSARSDKWVKVPQCFARVSRLRFRN